MFLSESERQITPDSPANFPTPVIQGACWHDGRYAGEEADHDHSCRDKVNAEEQRNEPAIGNAAEQVYKAGVVVNSASGFAGEVANSMDGLAKVAPNDATVPQWQP